MAREFSRSQRVSDQIQKILSAIIQTPIKDAGLGLVTISAIHLSSDLSYAKVYITCLSSGRGVDFERTAEIVEVVTLLNNGAAQFRRQLSKALAIRGVPELRFIFDETLERANRLTDLIDSLHTPPPNSSQAR